MSRNDNLTPVLIDPADAAELLCGTKLICDGMNNGIFSWGEAHYTSEGDGRSAEQNACAFVHENFDVIAGAFRMIGAASNIITTAIINGDLQIVPGKED